MALDKVFEMINGAAGRSRDSLVCVCRSCIFVCIVTSPLSLCRLCVFVCIAASPLFVQSRQQLRPLLPYAQSQPALDVSLLSCVMRHKNMPILSLSLSFSLSLFSLPLCVCVCMVVHIYMRTCGYAQCTYMCACISVNLSGGVPLLKKATLYSFLDSNTPNASWSNTPSDRSSSHLISSHLFCATSTIQTLHVYCGYGLG